MRALLQRVAQARVEVASKPVGSIAAGLLVLFCAERGDDDALVDRMLGKILRLRVFADDAGKMNRSVQDTAGGLLIVSQFTLAADVGGGNRPSFTGAAAPDEGRRLYDLFVARARAAHSVVATGVFAADMQVHLVNDGPVTIPIQMRAPTGGAAPGS
ncbi:MAG: D-tyrosyl-tRNA(Tyr) deacylase [Variovorax sp.]|nr:MAG: D-tyrosyl-tRNA(Tyr) deacylase [Variovorax sp.]